MNFRCVELLVLIRLNASYLESAAAHALASVMLAKTNIARDKL